LDCKIARNTDVGHAQLAKYVTRKSVYHLNDAVKHFQLVLNQCPVGHPDQAAALTNLAWARIKAYIQNDFRDIDAIISLFREALTLRPQGHSDYPLSIYHLTETLTWCYHKERTAVFIHESAQLFCQLLPLCPEGTYLRSIAAGDGQGTSLCNIAAGAHGVDYVIRECNKLPIDASNEVIRLQRIVLELCPLGNKHRPKALDKLARALITHIQQRGSIDDLDECIQRHREAVFLRPEGHSERDTHLNNLALSLKFRFDHHSNPNDLNEAISLYEEALRLRPVGHKSRASSLDNLGIILRIRFSQRGDVTDIMRAISLHREALILRLPGNPYRDSTLNNLALALKTRHVKLAASEDLNETIDLYRDSLRLR
jgi:tetratricopeptide (TPR) repeat protein